MTTAPRRTSLVATPGTGSTPSPAGAPPPTEGSALLLEIGESRSRAALVDLVDGRRHRFIASVNARTPGLDGDFATSIRGTVAALERETSHRLLESNTLISPARRDGGGVNAAVVTVGANLRLSVVGPADSPARSTLNAVISASSISVEDDVDPTVETRGDDSALGRLISLLAKLPDILVVLPPAESRRRSRGIDVGRYLSAALDGSPAAHPVILFIGGATQAAPYQEQLARHADFRLIDLGPSDCADTLRNELRAIWRDWLDSRIAGYPIAQSWATTPILPTAEAFALALRFLAARRGADVWGVDVGSGTSTIVQATATGAAIRTVPRGVASGVGWLLEGGAARSLVPGADPEAVRDALANRQARPLVCADTADSVALDQAIAREAVRAARRQFPQARCAWKQIPGLLALRGGGVESSIGSDQAVWSIAEALGATGLFEVAHDLAGIVPGLGALAGVAPVVAAEALLADGLSPLATFVIGEGQSRPNESAATVDFRYSDEPTRRVELSVGTPVTITLPAGESADVAVSPARGFDFGRGPGKPLTARILGGTLGVTFGAREARPRQAFAWRRKLHEVR